jgi:hypothetical protein
LQQDAMSNLSKSLDLSYRHKGVSTLEYIRNILNLSSGHPTDKAYGNESHPYNFISRHSLSLAGFTLLSTAPKKETRIQHLKNSDLILGQEKSMIILLKRIEKDLQQMKSAEKKRYASEQLQSIFVSVAYKFGKLYEDIRGSDEIHRGVYFLEEMEKQVLEFKSKVSERGLDMQAINHVNEIIPNTILRLKAFLENTDASLTMLDALAYCDALRSRIASLEAMAREIDEDYA